MIYDYNISENISLSKILDAFFIENEKPSVIITFLQQYDTSFDDIIKNSLYSDRLFQLDFILQCNINEIDYIIKKINTNKISIKTLYFIWQILKSNSYKVNHIKYALRDYIKDCNKNYKHPYQYGSIIVEQLDDQCIKYIDKNKTIFNILYQYYDNSELFLKYLNDVDKSLFKYRFMQFDFISQLKDDLLFVFLNNIYTSTDNFEKFNAQIFDSDIDFEIKKHCFNMSKNNVAVYITDNKYSDICNECESIAELLLKISIFGIDIDYMFILFLMFNKLNWLKEWIEFDKNTVDSLLNVSSFVSNLK
jgi:hypothetical protein